MSTRPSLGSGGWGYLGRRIWSAARELTMLPKFRSLYSEGETKPVHAVHILTQPDLHTASCADNPGGGRVHRERSIARPSQAG